MWRQIGIVCLFWAGTEVFCKKNILKINLNFAQGLKCWDGRAQNGTEADFKSVKCEAGETWCMEIHTKDEGKPVEDFKTCWDPTWDNGM